MAGNQPGFNGIRSDAEERLLIEAAQRDPARFAELYEDNFPFVYAYVARRLRDRDATEDLTSSVFQKALESLPRFTWRGVPFRAWLLRIAANMIADKRKRVGREQSVSEVDEETQTAAQINIMVNRADDPEQSLEEVEHAARLIFMVDQLPDDQRRVIQLRFGDEKSIREIAHELGRSEGAVKQLQFRGLENLRSRLGTRRSE